MVSTFMNDSTTRTRPTRRRRHPRARQASRATRILLRKPLHETRIKATKWAKREHEQVARRQLRMVRESGGGRREDGREAREQEARLRVERLQQRERRARLPATHQYRPVLVLLSSFVVSPAGRIGIVPPHVVVRRRGAQAERRRAPFDAIPVRTHMHTAPGTFARGPGPRPLVAQSTGAVAIAAAAASPEAGAERRAYEAHVVVHAPRVRPRRPGQGRACDAVRVCTELEDTVELGPLHGVCLGFRDDEAMAKVKWGVRTSFTSLQVKR